MSFLQSHRPQIKLPQRLGVLFVSLAALAIATPGFCGPIHDAARSGDLDKVKALVKEQPDLVSSKDEKYGQTPLHVAALNDRKDVAEFLIGSKADINARSSNGSTPLHLAAGRGYLDIVLLLLNNKADLNVLDNEGWSPAHTAVVFNQKAIAELIESKGGKEIPATPMLPTLTDTHMSAKTPAEKAPPIKTGQDGRFNLMDDGTVVDTKTMLMWMNRDNGSAMSWPDAKKFVADYRGAGYSDWRLPTLAEVSALYDANVTRRAFCPSAVDELGASADEIHLTKLIRLTCTRIWTSDMRDDKSGMALEFDFHAGKDAARPEAEEFVDLASRVLVVRKVK